MRRRRNLAAPAVREHICAAHQSMLARFHPDRDPVDAYVLRIMAGEPLEVWAYQLPGELSDWGLTVHDRVIVAADETVTVVEPSAREQP